jgi:RHS repeat-associated protein
VTDNTWTETGITYSNAPAMGTQLGSSGAITANTWTTVDVTSYITGNGTYNLAFSTTSNTNISFASREGANAPELVIVTSGGATNTPTNTPGPTPTPTKTSTPAGSSTPTVPPTVTPTTQPTFQNASFIYDGDGKRVKSIINNAITTYFVGAHYEVSGSTITKYYYAGSQRIAMRTNGTLNYLLGDHLGSTSLTTDAAGNKVSEIRYKAWGTVRYATENVPTKYQYTGQFSYEAEFGLYFYNARWYDPVLSRFAQADSIIPPGVQGYDRYAYTNNNPVRYVDPTGHCGVGVFLGLFGISYSCPTDRGSWVEGFDPAPEDIGLEIFVPVEEVNIIETFDPVPEDNWIEGYDPAPEDDHQEGYDPAPQLENILLSSGDTLQPGPYAGESIPARGPERNWTQEENEEIDRIGFSTGCHTCGTKNPGTKGGHFVPDHQPPTAINFDNLPQRLYPHCLSCSHRQAGQVTQHKRDR